MTLADFDRMNEAQQGKCAVCHREQHYMKAGKRLPLAIDHDHTTGEVRGLLCHSCNGAIGAMRESADIAMAASQYLRKHSRPAIGLVA